MNPQNQPENQTPSAADAAALQAIDALESDTTNPAAAPAPADGEVIADAPVTPQAEPFAQPPVAAVDQPIAPTIESAPATDSSSSTAPDAQSTPGLGVTEAPILSEAPTTPAVDQSSESAIPAAESSEATPVVAAAPFGQAQVAPKSKRTLILAIVAVVLLGVAAGLVYWYM